MNTGPAHETPDRDGGCEGHSAHGNMRQRGADRPAGNFAAKIANVAHIHLPHRGAAAARQAHNLKVAGSNPAPATKKKDPALLDLFSCYISNGTRYKPKAA